MKQLLQNYRSGKLSTTDVPASSARPRQVLVRTAASLVSVGTEKSMLELAKKNLLDKALARPDLVRQVIAKAQAEGILEAWRQAMGQNPFPLYVIRSSACAIGHCPDALTSRVIER